MYLLVVLMMVIMVMSMGIERQYEGFQQEACGAPPRPKVNLKQFPDCAIFNSAPKSGCFA
jgi:hypothetical protein